MTETKFTPGPWEIDRTGIAVSIPYRGPHCTANAYGGTEANAFLISAAPDLYEAIDGMLRWRLPHDQAFTVTEGSRRAFRKLEAALAKARGEQRS